MDVTEAREHLEIIDRIVAASSRSLHVGGEYFLVWGLVGGLIDLLLALVSDGRLPGTAMWSMLVLDAAGIAFTVARSRYYRRCNVSFSFLQREFLTVLWLTLGIAFICNLAAFHLFAGWGGAALWSIAAAIVLCFIAVHGNRRAMVAGMIVLASIIAANFMAPETGYVLAAGLIAGYGGFGLAELLA